VRISSSESTTLSLQNAAKRVREMAETPSLKRHRLPDFLGEVAQIRWELNLRHFELVAARFHSCTEFLDVDVIATFAVVSRMDITHPQSGASQ
jgi:hypothetical protein